MSCRRLEDYSQCSLKFFIRVGMDNASRYFWCHSHARMTSNTAAFVLAATYLQGFLLSAWSFCSCSLLLLFLNALEHVYNLFFFINAQSSLFICIVWIPEWPGMYLCSSTCMNLSFCLEVVTISCMRIVISTS